MLRTREITKKKKPKIKSYYRDIFGRNNKNIKTSKAGEQWLGGEQLHVSEQCAQEFPAAPNSLDFLLFFPSRL